MDDSLLNPPHEIARFTQSVVNEKHKEDDRAS